MAVTLWDHINADLDGKLAELIYEWHVKEKVGTPTIAKRLREQGYEVEQRTVWRWLKQKNIEQGGSE